MSDLLLLDTHVLLWAVDAPNRLSRQVRAAIEDRRYAVSAASLWELIHKKEKRDAPVKLPAEWWERYVTRQQTIVVPIPRGTSSTSTVFLFCTAIHSTGFSSCRRRSRK